MSHPCEEHAAELSALLDGEIDRGILLPTLDHLARCAPCRDFYRRARALDGTLALVRENDRGTGHGSLPGWREVERRSRRRLPHRRALAWSGRLAAGLLAAAGLAAALGTLGGPEAPPPGSVVEVRLEGDRGHMDEARFLELATELLRADRRYHLAMEQVLAEVNRRTFGREGSAEEAGAGDEAAAAAARRRPLV